MVFLRITDFVLKTRVYIFTFFRIFFPNFLVFSSLLPTYLFPALYFRYFIEWDAIVESNFRHFSCQLQFFFRSLFSILFVIDNANHLPFLSILSVLSYFLQLLTAYPLIYFWLFIKSLFFRASQVLSFFSFLSFVFRLLFYQKYIEKTSRRSRTKLRIFRASILSVVITFVALFTLCITSWSTIEWLPRVYTHSWVIKGRVRSERKENRFPT